MRMKVILAAVVAAAAAAVSTTTPTVAREPSDYTRCMMLASRYCNAEYAGDSAAIQQCMLNHQNGECAGLDGDPRNPGEICWIIGGQLVCQPG